MLHLQVRARLTQSLLVRRSPHVVTLDLTQSRLLSTALGQHGVYRERLCELPHSARGTRNVAGARKHRANSGASSSKLTHLLRCGQHASTARSSSTGEALSSRLWRLHTARAAAAAQMLDTMRGPALGCLLLKAAAMPYSSIPGSRAAAGWSAACGCALERALLQLPLAPVPDGAGGPLPQW